MVDLGDFWDLSDLIPKKKKTADRGPFKREIRLGEIREPEGDPRDRDEGRLGSIPCLSVSEESYLPTDNPLIRRVTVTARETGYSFYAQFRRHAEAYFDRREKECPYVPFFSYIPQYSQLSEEQLRYYFYFRDALRRGETPRVDYSYFWLYIYEILNLPDRILPRDGVVLLCRAWRLYRDKLPKIDKYMTVWLTDYCLLHRLPCPTEELSPFLDAVMEHSDFKEFYLGGISALTEDGTAALLAMISDYRFEKSRYAKGEHADFFRRHLFAVMREVFRVLFSSGRASIDTEESSVLSRAAFSGSLCSHNIKRTLTVEYLSFHAAAGLREAVTASVKYAENKLRALLSIKSRLSVPPLEPILSATVDRYFADLFSRAEAKRKIKERPSYEALYEAESRGFSLEGAKEIESLSWENARLLASEEETSETLLALADSSPEPSFETAPQEQGGSSPSLSHADAVYLHSLLTGDGDSRKRVLKTTAQSEDSIAERINLAFTELLGDIVLEASENGYTVIEDYLDEVMKWTEKRLSEK